MKQESAATDFILVNNNEMRVTAMLSTFFTAIYIYTGASSLALLMSADTALRSFKSGSYSISRIISTTIIDIFSVEAIPVNFAPHKFSASLAFILSMLISLLSIAGHSKIALVPALLLLLLSLLESIFGYCAGCRLYRAYKKYTN